jgi:uncharacterized membrane protein
MPAIAEQLPISQRRDSTRGFTAPVALKRAAAVWTTVALIGQAVFAVYVTAMYGRPMIMGDITRWSLGPTKQAYIAGDGPGNMAMGVHAVLAILILLASAIQLLPKIRRRWPAVHRWTGRAYLSAAVVTSLAGVYLLLARGTVGDLSQHIAITLNAAILVTCAACAWRTARVRDFAAHRRWALRTWLAASGVFFFRIYMMAWLLAWRAPVGFDPKTFSGPFLTLLAFGVYVIGPLALLELYLRAERSVRPVQQWATTGTLALLTLITTAGVIGATLGMWAPRIR